MSVLKVWNCNTCDCRDEWDDRRSSARYIKGKKYSNGPISWRR